MDPYGIDANEMPITPQHIGITNVTYQRLLSSSRASRSFARALEQRALVTVDLLEPALIVSSPSRKRADCIVPSNLRLNVGPAADVVCHA
jgi:hypothetical protein